MTGLPKRLAIATLLTAMAAMMSPAEARQPGYGDHDFTRSHGWSDPHVRYPGDQAYSFGTFRPNGPDKGPYVERCWWTANNTLFGLPLGLTQHCVRYTNENTSQ